MGIFHEQLVASRLSNKRMDAGLHKRARIRESVWLAVTNLGTIKVEKDPDITRTMGCRGVNVRKEEPVLFEPS
jgi:hypothetical protein